MSLKKQLIPSSSAIVFALLLVTTPAMAQGLQGRHYLSFSAGELTGDTWFEIDQPGFDLIDLDDGFLFMGRYEYGLTDRIGLEVSTGGATNGRLHVGSGFPGGELEIDLGEYLLNGGLVVNLTGGRIVPFAAVGMGLVHFFGDDFENETNLSVNFGAGLKVFVSRRLFLRLDVRDHVICAEDLPFFDADVLNLVEISGGVGVAF